MPEAGDLFLARQLRAHDRFRLPRRRVLSDVQQQPHDVRVGPAVQRPLQGANCGDDGGVDVGEGRRRHARGERRGVQLVIGVQNQRDIEGTRRETARPLARQHVEEIRGVTQDRIRRDRSGARVLASHRRDERADLRRQPHGLAIVGLRRLVAAVRIVVREGRRERSQQVHGVAAVARSRAGSPRQRPHETEDRLGQRASGDELRLQIAQLPARRQPPVPQQITDFLERGVPGEIVDVVPTIRQHAAIAVEITNRGRGRDGIFKARFGLRVRCHNHESYSCGPSRWR